MAQGCIRVNDAPVDTLDRVMTTNDKVTIDIAAPEQSVCSSLGSQQCFSCSLVCIKFDPSTIPLDVIFEDESILCVNKQAGLLCQPNSEFPLENLMVCILTQHTSSLKSLTASFLYRQSALHARFRAREEGGAGRVVPHLAHRIDRGTSGALLLALDHKSKKHLTKQFETRQVRLAEACVVMECVTVLCRSTRST